MRTLTEKYLGGLELVEDTYKVDLAVLDRYQLFSSELLRLSLLGIAGYGFLIANVVFKVATSGGQLIFFPSFSRSKFVLAAGAITLGISAATALGYRYFSTDCIAHYVRRLRLDKRCGELENDSSQSDGSALQTNKQIIAQEEASLEKDIAWCRWLLISSCLFLVFGAACIALGFAATLFEMPALQISKPQ